MTGHRSPIGHRGARYPDTILTRAYSGRFARRLANRFALEHDGHAPQANPEMHRLTRTLRATAIQAGDTNACQTSGPAPAGAN